jgi:hypothetical protein
LCDASKTLRKASVLVQRYLLTHLLPLKDLIFPKILIKSPIPLVPNELTCLIMGSLLEEVFSSTDGEDEEDWVVDGMGVSAGAIMQSVNLNFYPLYPLYLWITRKVFFFIHRWRE